VLAASRKRNAWINMPYLTIFLSPKGHRSFPPFTFVSLYILATRRWLIPTLIDSWVTNTTPEGETIFSLANKHVAIIPQIETRLGVKNLEAIISLDEVDAFMIGGKLRELVSVCSATNEQISC
jgi:hypothetical protein